MNNNSVGAGEPAGEARRTSASDAKRLGAESAGHLAEALKNNTTLVTLILFGNSIEEEGAKHLAGALKVNHKLTTRLRALEGADGGALRTTQIRGQATCYARAWAPLFLLVPKMNCHCQLLAGYT